MSGDMPNHIQLNTPLQDSVDTNSTTSASVIMEEYLQEQFPQFKEIPKETPPEGLTGEVSTAKDGEAETDAREGEDGSEASPGETDASPGETETSTVQNEISIEPGEVPEEKTTKEVVTENKEIKEVISSKKDILLPDKKVIPSKITQPPVEVEDEREKELKPKEQPKEQPKKPLDTKINYELNEVLKNILGNI